MRLKRGKTGDLKMRTSTLPTGGRGHRPAQHAPGYRNVENKRKPVHIELDYCPHCGTVDTWCGESTEEEDEWTSDPDKATCKGCLREYKKFNK